MGGGVPQLEQTAKMWIPSEKTCVSLGAGTIWPPDGRTTTGEGDLSVQGPDVPFLFVRSLHVACRTSKI